MVEKLKFLEAYDHEELGRCFCITEEDEETVPYIVYLSKCETPQTMSIDDEDLEQMTHIPNCPKDNSGWDWEPKKKRVMGTLYNSPINSWLRGIEYREGDPDPDKVLEVIDDIEKFVRSSSVSNHIYITRNTLINWIAKMLGDK